MDHLARLAANPPIEALRHILQTYWTLEEPGWINERMEYEREKLLSKKERQSAAGRKAIMTRWQKADTKRIPNEYESDTSQNQNQNHIQNISSYPSGKCESSSTIAPASSVPYQKIQELWAEVLPELPQPVKLSPARKAKIRARWQDELPDLDAWRECFGYVRASNFLMGKVDPPDGRRRFLCTLDWITKQENLLKLYEGKYDG
jgi:hypothetical protein